MTYTSFRNNLTKLRENGTTWRELGEQFKVAPGTLCRIAHDPAYRPRSRQLRQALGLCGPRRTYDVSNKQLREIGISILGKLYNNRG